MGVFGPNIQVFKRSSRIMLLRTPRPGGCVHQPGAGVTPDAGCTGGAHSFHAQRHRCPSGEYATC
jgi:hypothetical protein